MTILQDLRYALRTARRDRTFSLIAVIMLAFRSPEQLVRVTADFTRQPVSDVGLSIPELFDLRRADVFDDIAGVWPISANLTETDELVFSVRTMEAGGGVGAGRAPVHDGCCWRSSR